MGRMKCHRSVNNYYLDFKIFEYSHDPPSLFPTDKYAVHPINRSVLLELVRIRTMIDANTTVNSKRYESTRTLGNDALLS